MNPIELESTFAFIRQWASSIINYSSAFNAEEEYSPSMALGVPDCYPSYGDCENAWFV